MKEIWSRSEAGQRRQEASESQARRMKELADDPELLAEWQGSLQAKRLARFQEKNAVRDARIREMRETGATYNEIAADVGCSRGTVKNVLRGDTKYLAVAPLALEAP